MPKEIKSYRVVLTVSHVKNYNDSPERWDWHSLLDMDGVNDTVTVEEVEDIDPNPGHVETLNDELE